LHALSCAYLTKPKKFSHFLLFSPSVLMIDSIEPFEEPPKLYSMCRTIGPWPGWCVQECKVTKERPRCAYNTFTLSVPSCLFRMIHLRCVYTLSGDARSLLQFYFTENEFPFYRCLKNQINIFKILLRNEKS